MEVFDESQQGRGGKMNEALDAIFKSLDIDDTNVVENEAAGQGDDLLSMMDSVS